MNTKDSLTSQFSEEKPLPARDQTHAQAVSQKSDNVPARSYGRSAFEARPCTLERQVMKYADGSCLITCGDTRVLCSATVEDTLPAWRKLSHLGWVSAEYAMLPASATRRTPREYKGRKGRSMEIERLIGRSLRSVVDFSKLGEHTITIDCDVLQADGGTRTASIVGAWVALHDACRKMVEADKIARCPLTGQVAAISMGIVRGQLLVDLDYPEDSNADVDLNVVMRDDGGLVEIQGTGERATLSRHDLNALLDASEPALTKLFALQKSVTNF
ncbi:ribonuclease PH [Fannyhessea vaginae]|uniref:ribonuclease PH n=1 Tax=Fannyhessea vaginae TaxID=82135 RepID=UPI003A808482